MRLIVTSLCSVSAAEEQRKEKQPPVRTRKMPGTSKMKLEQFFRNIFLVTCTRLKIEKMFIFGASVPAVGNDRGSEGRISSNWCVRDGQRLHSREPRMFDSPLSGGIMILLWSNLLIFLFLIARVKPSPDCFGASIF